MNAVAVKYRQIIKEETKMKKALSLILCTVMVLSVFSCLATSVSAAEKEVVSIDFTPVNDISFCEYTNTLSSYEYDENSGKRFIKYQYNVYGAFWEDGNVITLRYSDGTSEDFTCSNWEYFDEDGCCTLDEDLLSINPGDQTTQWEVGTHYGSVSYGLATVSVPIEITASPVESVDFVPVKAKTYRQGCDGWVNVFSEGPEEGRPYFMYLWEDLYSEGNKFVVKYKDQRTVTYTSDGNDFVAENGECMDMEGFLEIDTQYVEPWTETGEHAFEFRYFGCKGEVPVTITENPVQSVEYIPGGKIKVIEGYGGFDQECDCEVCRKGNGQYFEYNFNFYNFPYEGDKIVVNYKDGTVAQYTAVDGYFKDDSGNMTPYEYYCDTDQAQNHWGVGEHKIQFIFMGQTVEVPVEIIENPIEKISVSTPTPVEFYEETNGTWNYTYDEETAYFDYDCPLFTTEGVSITLTYSDKTTEEYFSEFEGEDVVFRSKDGKKLNDDELFVESDQESNPWGVGKHAFTVEYYGVKCDLPVAILENPVESIEFKTASPIVFKYEIDGEWEDSYDWETGETNNVFIYDTTSLSPYTQGNKLIVNYKSGVTDVFTFSEDEGEFLNKKGEPLPYAYTITYSEAQYVLPWELDAETNYIVVDYMGRYNVVRISLDDSHLPEAAEIASCYNTDGKITLGWFNVGNATEYIVYRRDGNGKWQIIGTTTDNYFVDGKNIREGVDYTYFVHSKNSMGQSTYTADKAIITRYVAPLRAINVSNYDGSVWINCGVTSGENAYFRTTLDDEEWTFIGTAPADEIYIFDPDVESGETYIYAAAKLDGDYMSELVISDEITYLSAPKITKAINIENGIYVNWNETFGAEYYNVYRKTENSGWVLLGKSYGTTYVDTTAEAGTTYTYTVRASANGFLSAYKSGTSVKRIATPKVSGVSNGANGLYVKWDKIDGATEYRVYRKSLVSGWEFIATTKNTYYTDSQIKDKNGYYYGYTVIAVSDGVASGFVDDCTMTKRLSAPQLKQAKNVASGVQVTWNKVNGATSYYVYRKTANTGWILLGKAGETSYIDTTAKSGTTYTYTVRAVYNKTMSVYESGISVKCLAQPKLSGVSNSNNGIYVKWGKVAGATQYRVYRKTLNSGWKYIGTTKNTYYTDSGIKNNSGYYYGYTVIAVSGNTYSSFDNNGIMTKRLPAPTLGSAIRTADGVEVSWSAVKGAKDYNVYRKTGNGGWVLLGKATGTEYTDFSAEQGVAYTYTVRACYNGYISTYNTKGVSVK